MEKSDYWIKVERYEIQELLFSRLLIR